METQVEPKFRRSISVGSQLMTSVRKPSHLRPVNIELVSEETPVDSPNSVEGDNSSAPTTPSTPLTPSNQSSAPTTPPCTPPTTPPGGSPAKQPLNHVTAALWKNQPGVDEVIGSLEKKEIQRQEVMHEVITSEASYVKDLEATKKLFLFPLNKFKVITSEESDDIFGDINKLIKLNSELLQLLRKRQTEQWPVLDDISDLLVPFFADIYKHYHRQCEKIKSSSAKVVDLVKTNSNFASFMETLTRNEGVDVLGLNSYLIKPLQRVTKYALLMRELQKHTPPDHHSYPNVSLAMSHIEKALGDINEFTRSNEQQGQLFDIQQSLDTSDVSVPITIPQQGRTLVRQGPIRVELYVTSTKDTSKKDLYGFLFSDMLLLTKKRRKGTEPKSQKGSPPTSPQLGGGVSYKVVAEPLYLITAEKHIKDNRVLYEFFSSFAMTMYVIEVPVTSSPDDPTPNDQWASDFDRAVSSMRKVSSSEEKAPEQPTEVEAKPKLNAVQANLWKNQPGARSIWQGMDKMEVQRQECIHELVVSEAAYVKDLNTTLQLFYRPLGKFQILPSEEIEYIFGDIPKLHRINGKLLEELEERKKEQWPTYVDVSDILVPFFEKIYANYCNHCQKTKACSARVVELLASNTTFADFMSTLTRNEGVDVLGLNSYLIKPLQRITKYNLLLREIQKSTPQSHPSYAGVTRAYELVCKALTDINESQRQAEFAEQVGNIEQRLDLGDVGSTLTLAAPNRRLMKEGQMCVDMVVKKKTKKTIKDAHAFLFNDCLLLTKKKQGKDTTSKLKFGTATSLKRQSNSLGNLNDPNINCTFKNARPFIHGSSSEFIRR